MPQLSFEQWKYCLLDECRKSGKMMAFNAIGDYVLRVLWESNLEPTVEAITSDGDRSSSMPRAI